MCDNCDIERALRDVEQRRRPADTGWFWTELGLLAEHWDAAGHPVVRGWRGSGPFREDLRPFANEGDHVALATRALASALPARIGGDLGATLDGLAQRERELAEYWRAVARIAGSAGPRRVPDAAPQTRQLVRTWLGPADRPVALDLVTLRIVLTAQGRVAKALLAALTDAGATGPALAWFGIRAAEATAPPAALDAALETHLRGPLVFEALAQAEASLRAYWHFFDALARSRPDHPFEGVRR